MYIVVSVSWYKKINMHCFLEYLEYLCEYFYT